MSQTRDASSPGAASSMSRQLASCMARHAAFRSPDVAAAWMASSRAAAACMSVAAWAADAGHSRAGAMDVAILAVPSAAMSWLSSDTVSSGL